MVQESTELLADIAVMIDEKHKVNVAVPQQRIERIRPCITPRVNEDQLEKQHREVVLQNQHRCAASRIRVADAVKAKIVGADGVVVQLVFVKTAGDNFSPRSRLIAGRITGEEGC